ncbi:KOW domain-containing RNA-binding protein [Gorillibacterium timonense]|uniref:KOW domain-containing RNA-binding protein n=1 Tax=Gorillibacterium timonense TaxID=1689269 RepID=UPI00071CDB90|nr:KOW domain-containing RNA-binding protein [Gorillibacterium timonense]
MRTAQIGQLVRILRGRGLEQYAVIIGIEDARFVWIADGDKRKFDQPKKKNIQHLELLEEVSREVADSLNETGRVTNGKLRFAVLSYRKNADLTLEAHERGE